MSVKSVHISAHQKKCAILTISADCNPGPLGFIDLLEIANLSQRLKLYLFATMWASSLAAMLVEPESGIILTANDKLSAIVMGADALACLSSVI